MRIVVAHPQADARRRWIAGLRTALPQYDVLASDDPAAAGADYAVGWKLAPGFFDSQTRLKALFAAGAGVDQLLEHPGLPAQLPVVRLEDAGMARQMAAYCCHEVARIFYRYGEYEAQQRDARWQELPVASLADFTVGLLGFGVLGSQVASALRGFGFRVIGHSRTEKSADGVQTYHGSGAMPAFLARCRVLILMAPLTAETRGLVDARALAQLPPGAWLINVARGPLVVEEDLLAAIDSGRLAGATLDVFHTEPLPSGHPFWRHPRIRVTPHIAAVTLVEESAAQVADKLRRLERGEAIGGVIDRHRGY